MKTNVMKREVEVNTTSSTEFKISNSGKAKAKAFKVLISGLYANKIQSVTREIWSNALDSHVMAGTAHIPFDISFPNMFEPNFRVRDYGIGLTHDEVIGLYTTLFESTKEDTDSQTGKFGLGSKSPFAYTDSFSVVSVKYGKKNYYSAILDEDGIPTIHHLHEEIVDEPNGVEVSFPVRKEDLNSFQHAVKRVSLGFDVKPNVTNQSDFEWPSDSAEYLRNGIYVRMGCVIYPVETDIISEKLDTDEKVTFLEKCSRTITVLEVPMGSVEISASRESLSYGRNEPTVQTIIEELDKYQIAMKDMMDKFVNSLPSMHIAEGMCSNSLHHDWHLYFNTKFDLSMTDMKIFENWKHVYHNLKYKGNFIQTVGRSSIISLGKHVDIRADSFNITNKTMPKATPSVGLNLSFNKMNYIYIRDISYPTNKKAESARREFLKKVNAIRNVADYNANNIYVEMHGNISSKISFFEQLEAKYVEGVDYEIILIDEFVPPPPVKRQVQIVKKTIREKIQETKFLVIDQNDWFEDSWDGCDISSEKFTYMNDENTEVIILHHKVGSSTDFYNSSKYYSNTTLRNNYLNMFKEMSRFYGKPIIIVTQSNSKIYHDFYVNHVKFENIDLEPFVDKMVLVHIDKLKSEMSSQNIHAKYAFKNSYGVRDNLAKLHNLDETKLFGSYMKLCLDRDAYICQYSEDEYSASVCLYNNLSRLNSYLLKKFDTNVEDRMRDELKNKIREKEEKIKANYPLLDRLLHWNNCYDTKDMNAMIEYIKLIDNVR